MAIRGLPGLFGPVPAAKYSDPVNFRGLQAAYAERFVGALRAAPPAWYKSAEALRLRTWAAENKVRVQWRAKKNVAHTLMINSFGNISLTLSPEKIEEDELGFIQRELERANELAPSLEGPLVGGTDRTHWSHVVSLMAPESQLSAEIQLEELLSNREALPAALVSAVLDIYLNRATLTLRQLADVRGANGPAPAAESLEHRICEYLKQAMETYLLLAPLAQDLRAPEEILASPIRFFGDLWIPSRHVTLTFFFELARHQVEIPNAR
ncbi:hypothetical protein K2X33_07750 [bacterium]|nr:hypothetical protein [bacterium]